MLHLLIVSNIMSHLLLWSCNLHVERYTTFRSVDADTNRRILWNTLFMLSIHIVSFILSVMYSAKNKHDLY